MIRSLLTRLRDGALDKAGAAVDRALVHAALDVAHQEEIHGAGVSHDGAVLLGSSPRCDRPALVSSC